MRASGLLHAELAAIVAALGHGQTLCVADAGLPVAAGATRVQLGFAPGRPGFLEVLDAVLEDLVVEGATVAAELEDAATLDGIGDRLADADIDTCTHDELKRRTAGCVAIVQTGEFRRSPASCCARASRSDGAASPGG